MIVEIKHPVTPEKVREAFRQLKSGSKKKSLREHFGKLKRDADPVSYQRKLRDEWN